MNGLPRLFGALSTDVKVWKQECINININIQLLPEHASHRLAPVSYMTQFFLWTNKEARTSCHLRLGLRSVPFPSGFSTNMQNVLLIILFLSSWYGLAICVLQEKLVLKGAAPYLLYCDILDISSSSSSELTRQPASGPGPFSSSPRAIRIPC
jgi:hypothetical protein